MGLTVSAIRDATVWAQRAIVVIAVGALSVVPAREAQLRLHESVRCRREAMVDRAWTEVRDFFVSESLPVPEASCPPVRFVDAREIRDATGTPVLGVFRHDTVSVVVSTFRGYVRARGDWLGMPPTRSLYRSFLVHELTHALVHHAAPNLTVARQEYLAYVVQISLLPRRTRERLLARNPLASFQSPFVSVDRSGPH